MVGTYYIIFDHMDIGYMIVTATRSYTIYLYIDSYEYFSLTIVVCLLNHYAFMPITSNYIPTFIYKFIMIDIYVANKTPSPRHCVCLYGILLFVVHLNI